MIRIAPLLLAGLMLAPCAVLAGPSSHQHREPAGGMAGGCHEMMAEMKAKDATLDEKVAEMNAAQGEAKVDAIASVLTELVSQRKAMHEKMNGMPTKDGCGMMAH